MFNKFQKGDIMQMLLFNHGLVEKDGSFQKPKRQLRLEIINKISFNNSWVRNYRPSFLKPQQSNIHYLSNRCHLRDADLLIVTADPSAKIDQQPQNLNSKHHVNSPSRVLMTSQPCKSGQLHCCLNR